MGRFIVKTARDRDQYMEWSSIVDAPTAIGTRQEMLVAGIAPERLNRAATRGTSILEPDDVGGWGDHLMYRQDGILPRDKFGQFADLYEVDHDAAVALLVPLDIEETER